MKIKFALLLFIFITTVGYSQVAGESVYQFLNVSTSARQIALGGEVLNLDNDINQPIWNPAVINNDLDRKISVNYSSYISGINIGSISYARQISRRFGTLHSTIKYLDYGELIGADENGNETGNFSAKDIAVSIGYSYNLPNSNFYLGSNIKFISSNIGNFSSTGIAADLALLYKNLYKPFSFTLVVRNIGTQLSTFNGTSEKLPLKIGLGASYKLQYVPLKWYVTVDNLQKWDISEANPSNSTTDLEGNITEDNTGFIGNTLRHFVIGAELFPDSLINVRLGYNFKRAAELKLLNARTFSGVSFGFGVKMNRFKFNYAHSKFHTASNISTFSLEIDLDNNRY